MQYNSGSPFSEIDETCPMQDTALSSLLLETIQRCLDREARILGFAEQDLDARGYSGAAMRRFSVSYSAGGGPPQVVTLIIKEARLAERQALALLYRQNQLLIPFNYAPDLTSPVPSPVCMEYLAPDVDKPGANEMARAARGLAAIHLANLRDASLLDWAPAADQAYFESGYVLGTFCEWWRKAMEDSDFRREFGHYEPRLEKAAECFLHAMRSLWEEGDTLTLIHGDLHDGNIVVKGRQPFIVDWEQVRRGSFYIDLPNLFTSGQAILYWQALAEAGFRVPESEFRERYHEAGRYVGFKYLAFHLYQWSERDLPGSQIRFHLNDLIDLALHGKE